MPSHLRTHVAVFALAGLSLGGCSADHTQPRSPNSRSSPSSPPQSGQPADAAQAHAELDPASRTIILPADRFAPTEAEARDIESARGVLHGVCLEAHGVPGHIPTRRNIPEIAGDRRFGVWVMADAETWGYVVPESDAKKEAMGQRGGPGLTEDQIAIAEQCAQSEDVAALRLDLVTGPWQHELATASMQAQESPEWAAVIAEHHACLREQGLTPAESNALSVEGVDTAALDAGIVKPEDVEKAVKDVTCKERVRLVQRLADLEAQAQAPVVQHYRTELQAQRAHVESMLERANEVLREHGL